MAQMRSLHLFTIASISVYGPINADRVPVSHPSAMYDSNTVGRSLCLLVTRLLSRLSLQKLKDR